MNIEGHNSLVVHTVKYAFNYSIQHCYTSYIVHLLSGLWICMPDVRKIHHKQSNTKHNTAHICIRLPSHSHIHYTWHYRISGESIYPI